MVFISKYSLSSERLKREIEIIQEENEKGITTPFIFPIYLDDGTNSGINAVADLLKDAKVALQKEDK